MLLLQPHQIVACRRRSWLHSAVSRLKEVVSLHDIQSLSQLSVSLANLPFHAYFSFAYLDFPSETLSQAMSKEPLGNVLVIGGSGFLGSHIVEYLLSSSNSSIIVLSRHAKQTPELIPGIEYHNADMTSLPSILDVFKRIQPDVVMHTVSPSPTKATEAEFQKVNVEGTRNVIEACQKTGVKALIYTSTCAVIQGSFKTACENADESWPVITGSTQKDPYSRTKARSFPPLTLQCI